jgi:putative membrane protein
LFYFVVSAFCLWLTSYLLPGFAISGFVTTVVAAILISVISAVVTNALHDASGEPRKSHRR